MRRWWIARNSSEDATNYAIVADGRVAGGVGYDVGVMEYSRSAEIGYWLAQPYWHRGLATQALRAVTDRALEDRDLLRIFARVYGPNTASARVLEKCGYVCEGTMRRAVFKDGAVYDVLLYAMVR